MYLHLSLKSFFFFFKEPAIWILHHPKCLLELLPGVPVGQNVRFCIHCTQFTAPSEWLWWTSSQDPMRHFKSKMPVGSFWEINVGFFKISVVFRNECFIWWYLTSSWKRVMRFAVILDVQSWFHYFLKENWIRWLQVIACQDLAMGLQNPLVTCKHFLVLKSSSYCQRWSGDLVGKHRIYLGNINSIFSHLPSHKKDFMLQEPGIFCSYLLLYSRHLEQCLVSGIHTVTNLWVYEACFSASPLWNSGTWGQKEPGINFFDFSDFKHFFLICGFIPLLGSTQLLHIFWDEWDRKTNF